MAGSSFIFNNPRVERIVSGRGSIAKLPEEVERLGGTRAFLVTSPSVAKTRLLHAVKAALGVKCVAVFEQVKPHSPTVSIETATEQARVHDIDLLISVGGGSAIDTAKGVAALLAEGGPLPRLAVRFTPPDKKEIPPMPAPKAPHIAIPTTFSGGEYSYSVGISEGGRKLIVADPKLSPRTVLLDPEAPATAPRRLLAASGMNALAHCVEAVYSTESQPLTEAYCLKAIGLIARYLPRAVEASQDLESMSYVQVAACLSGMGVYSAWTGIHHAVVHAIGGRYQVPHAEVHALMLPHAMRWNLDAVAQAYTQMAREMGLQAGSDHELAASVPERVFEMNRRMGLPLKLRELGVPRDGLRQLATDALADYSMYTNPKPVHAAEQVLELLEQAW
ncbi:MAG TPA: iron-containing alcohol dehydrogenase [Candidatus Eisenbacteria bacterium]|nr:iron-containing alcohol dehydrogenase [Candidatus Eisenbacteria bacterium]